MAQVAYYATALTGGGATALDFIDGNDLNDGDFAFAFFFTGGDARVLIYVLDADHAGTEDGTFIITPDSNPGNKRWILASAVGDYAVQAAKTADYTLTRQELLSSTMFHNSGAVAAVNLTEPAAGSIAGGKLRMIVTEAHYLKFTTTNSRTIKFGTTAGAANGYIRSNEIGNYVELQLTDNIWYITSILGAWKYDE